MSSGRPVESAPPAIALRDPAVVMTSVVLLLITVAAWVHVVTSSMDGMRGAPMAGSAPGTVATSDGASMPGHASMADHGAMSGGGSTAATLGDALTFVVAWAIMMAAMMLPSALPMIGLYAATQRTQRSAVARATSVTLFALVYIVLWGLFGVPVYAAGKVADAIASPLVPYGIAAVLVVAGLYQLTPLKQVCLRNCRSPIGFLLGHWRPGFRGGLTMGASHALYCLGCCWALMVVLVAAGAMGLAWVLLIAAVVAAEKLVPGGQWIARGSGVALLILGLAVAVRPDVAAALRGAHVM